MTRINTNVQSLVAQRALGINNTSLSQALNRLSTGLRINSGRDDPAGLIASETLRASIRAIDQSIDNARRADTIIAVAEGGLQELSALLLEIESLVDSSANEAGLTTDEVSANQLQIDSILDSIDRIAEQTAFGSRKLLNGDFDFTTSGLIATQITSLQINAAKIPNGATRQVNVSVVTGSEFAKVSAVLGGMNGSGLRGAVLSAATTFQVRGNLGSDLLSFASGTSAADVVTAINSSTALTGVSAITSGGAGGMTSVILASTDYGADALVSVSALQNPTQLFLTTSGSEQEDKGLNGTITVNGSAAIVNGLDVSVRAGSLSIDMTLAATIGGVSASSTSFVITGGGATFQISPIVGLSGQETIGIGEVSSAKLGSSGIGFLSSLGSGQTNDLASKNFTTAQRVIRQTINQVASLRGRLGAFQKNTLSTTINALGIARENVTAAESAIRDADFAKETSDLTRAQILVNSSTTVLQIANAQPQNALALLG